MSSGKRVKEGKLRRYKSKFLGAKWVECKAVLYPDSTFIWFEDENESSPNGTLQLTQVAPFFAVGIYTTRLRNRPPLPTGTKVDHLVAFGTGPSKDAKIHWFLCSNDDDINSWMAAIVSTLPPPPQPPQQPPPPLPPPSYSQGPTAPQGYYSQAPGYPQQAPPGAWSQGYQYPQGPPPGVAPPTMVMAPSSYPSSGRSSGWGTAAGLGGGMLAGGLAGYALGSMMHPHGMGWGMGSGYGGPGGGYYDNDTTVINNYNTTNVTEQGDSSGNFDYGGGDNFDYGGGGDNFDYGGGLDDGGDFDFGGGDV